MPRGRIVRAQHLAEGPFTPSLSCLACTKEDLHVEAVCHCQEACWSGYCNGDAAMRDPSATSTLMNAYGVQLDVRPVQPAPTLLVDSRAGASWGTQVRTPNLLLLESLMSRVLSHQGMDLKKSGPGSFMSRGERSCRNMAQDPESFHCGDVHGLQNDHAGAARPRCIGGSQ